MTGIFTGKTPISPGTYARLKVSQTPEEASPLSPGLSDAEKRLTDLLDLSPEVQNKVSEGRKVSAHLSVFGRALKILNGFFSGYKPVASKVSVEFFTPEKPQSTVRKA